MAIRRGDAWGTVGPVPEGTLTVHSDAELHDLVAAHRQAGAALPPVALLGGDLMRAVGGTGDERRLMGEVAILPVDLVRVDADGGRCGWFAAHLVARRSWWRGALVAAVNGQFVGRWDVAPRAHPGDGRVDVVTVAPSMSVRDRWRARARLTHGTHLPHPAIDVVQRRTADLEFAVATHVWLDGRRWATARSLTVTVEPGALTVVI